MLVLYVGGPRDQEENVVPENTGTVDYSFHRAEDRVVLHRYERTAFRSRADGCVVFLYAGETRRELPRDPLFKRALCWLGVAQQSVLAIP